MKRELHRKIESICNEIGTSAASAACEDIVHDLESEYDKRVSVGMSELDAYRDVLKNIDYVTLLLLAGLFLVIDGIDRVGIIQDLSNLIAKLGGGNVFLTYTIIVWFSVLASAFIDNIPYTATMLPVVAGVATAMGVDQTVLCFGLLTGATLGGNLTPVGASANIAAGGILRKAGYEVSTAQFMKIGIPFTLAAVVTGYVLVWVLFGM